jgi:membrane-associated phospholipid phosphatase
MDLVYVPFESPGASFPSSHVAVAIVTVYFSFLYVRSIRWPHLALAVLLCASTVYGRYHYVSDVFGGALAAALLIPFGNYLYRRFDRPSRIWRHTAVATPIETPLKEQPVAGR